MITNKTNHIDTNRKNINIYSYAQPTYLIKIYIKSITNKIKWPEDPRQGETSREIYKEKRIR